MTVANGWHSKVLRLLVTEAIGKDLNAYDATYIKPYVDHAVAKGLYVIIDLHLVRNYAAGRADRVRLGSVAVGQQRHRTPLAVDRSYK